MKRALAVLLTLLALVGGCAAPPPIVAPTPTSASKKIRIGLPNTAFVRYVPLNMALEQLRAEGYTIEVVQAARFDLIPEMLARGEVDLGSLSPQGAWAAVAKGAALISLVANFAPTWTIVTSAQVKQCSDLAQYPVAFSTTQGIQQTMLAAYAKQHCPGTVPQILVVSGSSERAVALQGGHIDAASIELEDLLRLNQDAPGAFRPLLRASRDFPNVQIAVISSTREWAQKNPQAVKDLIRALVLANRRVDDDPAALQAEISKQLGVDAAKAKQLGDAFLAEKIWDPNGGLTEQNIELTLDLLKGIASVPASLKSSDVADLSYLNAVLAELGRK